jgi:hypothetical protein
MRATPLDGHVMRPLAVIQWNQSGCLPDGRAGRRQVPVARTQGAGIDRRAARSCLGTCGWAVAAGVVEAPDDRLMSPLEANLCP